MLLFAHLHTAAAQDAEQIRTQIDATNKKIEELKKEIDQYQKELMSVAAQKQTLQSTIRSLELTQKKLSNQIQITTRNIEETDFAIRSLELEIFEKEILIRRDTEVIADTIRKMDELGNETFFETLLKHNNLSEFWDELEVIQQFQLAVQENLRSLQALKNSLQNAKEITENKKRELVSLHTELRGEKSALDASRADKESILNATENKEENYQKLLKEKIKARDTFLSELRAYESQLQFILNPSTIPRAGSGVLAWPFETSYMLSCPSFQSALGNAHCITQYFGNTAFARSGAYNGSGHNGVDFRAPQGTKVLSALAGRVVGVGNTDAVRGCYSYGKWILVQHNNGLSTLYAHLSHISVAQGQVVGTGELLGFSGNTGYSTGPHLHLSVFATEGVKVQRLSDIPGRPMTACSAATIPVAGFGAYLNPLDYL